jgi:hypothetical protein
VQLIRRLYLYVMSGITLAILAVGLRMLASVLLDTLNPGGVVIESEGGAREQLSLAGALIGVGLPAWVIHWWLVRRGLQGPGEDAQEERRSAVRGLYLALVLAGALVFIAISATDLVREVLLQVMGLARPSFARADVPESLATLLIAAVVWLYHFRVHDEDTSAGPLGDGAVWWPRVYLYGTLLITLTMGASAAGDLLEGAIRILLEAPAAFGDARGIQAFTVAQAALVLVLALAFTAHAWHAGRLLRDPGWQGAIERPSRLRVAFLATVVGISGFAVLMNLVSVGRAIALQLLGVPGVEAGVGQPTTLAEALAIPLLRALPWLLVGLAARRLALAEGTASDVRGRRAAVGRLDEYGVSLLGLAFGAVGLASVLGLAIDAVLGGPRFALTGDTAKSELATFLPAALVGLALWAWRWSGITARATVDPAGEAGSTIRRTALLLVLGVSLIASVISLAVILYRLFNLLLGVRLGASVVSELSTPLGVLLVAAAVAAYHGALVRRDARLRSAVAPVPAAGPPGLPAAAPATIAPAPAPGSPAAPGAPKAAVPASRTLVLRAGSARELDAILGSLRASLPPGARLEDG